MKVKVTFSDRDEILGAVIRALAVQAAGFQVVGGMNSAYLATNGFYRFKFSNPGQTARFIALVRNYVPTTLQAKLSIEELPN
jgi:hypothetical protein